MDPEVIITATIRTTNAVLWTVVALQIWRENKPLIPLARVMILPVILFGMWMLVVGSLVTAGIMPGVVARNIYTIYTGAAAIIALVLVVSHTSDDE